MGAARKTDEVNDLAADQLERFPVIATFPIAALTDAGFEVVPTFRTPHVTLAFTGDLDERLTTAHHPGRQDHRQPLS